MISILLSTVITIFAEILIRTTHFLAFLFGGQSGLHFAAVSLLLPSSLPLSQIGSNFCGLNLVVLLDRESLYCAVAVGQLIPEWGIQN